MIMQVLLYLLEASLVPNRLIFAISRDLADDPTRHACLFALSLIPLLGGGALLATPEVLLQRLLPVCISPEPATAALALCTVQNTAADIRLSAMLHELEVLPTPRACTPCMAIHAHPLTCIACLAQVLPTLREAAATLPAELSSIACGAIANLMQLEQQAAEAMAEAQAGEPRPPHASCRAPEGPHPHAALPPPPAERGSAEEEGHVARPLEGVSHRSVPRLCVMLAPWAPAAVQRRGMAGLRRVLSARSVDAPAALELLRRCGTAARLMDLLQEGPSDDGGGAPRSGWVGPPPAQPDASLREGAMHLLALISHLGGIELLTPIDRVCAIMGGALLSPATATQLQAAAFWRAASVWHQFAAALGRAIFPLEAVRTTGFLPTRGGGGGGRSGMYTSGLGVLRAMALHPPAGGSTAPRDASALTTDESVSLAAACALAHVLQHAPLRPLWTTEPEKLSYLTRIDEPEAISLLALPDTLAREAAERAAARLANGAAAANGSSAGPPPPPAAPPTAQRMPAPEGPGPLMSV